MPGMPRFTKTPPDVLAAFEAARPTRRDVDRRTMFGYPALFVRGNMFAFTFGPKVAVRLGASARARAATAGAAAFEVMPGRAMTEYVAVPPSAMKGAALKKWLADALAYADTLPPKGAAKTLRKTTVKTATKTTAKTAKRTAAKR
ncbi:MAG TPA: TfoX/Sxy family protein [Candidatus Limnocylindria bacterium]|nr:TfoX/Sxy family protein [Candidatus Limnocylindria bacterium]